LKKRNFQAQLTGSRLTLTVSPRLAAFPTSIKENEIHYGKLTGGLTDAFNDKARSG
jgi:hypothetical protein